MLARRKRAWISVLPLAFVLQTGHNGVVATGLDERRIGGRSLTAREGDEASKGGGGSSGASPRRGLQSEGGCCSFDADVCSGSSYCDATSEACVNDCEGEWIDDFGWSMTLAPTATPEIQVPTARPTFPYWSWTRPPVSRPTAGAFPRATPRPTSPTWPGSPIPGGGGSVPYPNPTPTNSGGFPQIPMDDSTICQPWCASHQLPWTGPDPYMTYKCKWIDCGGCAACRGPTQRPTMSPTVWPTYSPTALPTYKPTISPMPTMSPTSSAPTPGPTMNPTYSPTSHPTISSQPTTSHPTATPTDVPTDRPTSSPTAVPSELPTNVLLTSSAELTILMFYVSSEMNVVDMALFASAMEEFLGQQFTLRDAKVSRYYVRIDEQTLVGAPEDVDTTTTTGQRTYSEGDQQWRRHLHEGGGKILYPLQIDLDVTLEYRINPGESMSTQVEYIPRLLRRVVDDNWGRLVADLEVSRTSYFRRIEDVRAVDPSQKDQPLTDDEGGMGRDHDHDEVDGGGWESSSNNELQAVGSPPYLGPVVGGVVMLVLMLSGVVMKMWGMQNEIEYVEDYDTPGDGKKHRPVNSFDELSADGGRMPYINDGEHIRGDNVFYGNNPHERSYSPLQFHDQPGGVGGGTGYLHTPAQTHREQGIVDDFYDSYEHELDVETETLNEVLQKQQTPVEVRIVGMEHDDREGGETVQEKKRSGTSDNEVGGDESRRKNHKSSKKKPKKEQPMKRDQWLKPIVESEEEGKGSASSRGGEDNETVDDIDGATASLEELEQASEMMAPSTIEGGCDESLAFSNLADEEEEDDVSTVKEKVASAPVHKTANWPPGDSDSWAQETMGEMMDDGGSRMNHPGATMSEPKSYHAAPVEDMTMSHAVNDADSWAQETMGECIDNGEDEVDHTSQHSRFDDTRKAPKFEQEDQLTSDVDSDLGSYAELRLGAGYVGEQIDDCDEERLYQGELSSHKEASRHLEKWDKGHFAKNARSLDNYSDSTRSSDPVGDIDDGIESINAHHHAFDERRMGSPVSSPENIFQPPRSPPQEYHSEAVAELQDEYEKLTLLHGADGRSGFDGMEDEELKNDDYSFTSYNSNKSKSASVGGTFAAPGGKPKATTRLKKFGTRSFDIDDSFSAESGVMSLRSEAGKSVCHESSSERDRFSRAEDDQSYDRGANLHESQSGLVQRELLLPSGNLGIEVESVGDGPFIRSIQDDSELKGMLHPGDIIVALNDADASCMSPSDVSQWMVRHMRGRRHITILSPQNGGGSEAHDSSTEASFSVGDDSFLYV